METVEEKPNTIDSPLAGARIEPFGINSDSFRLFCPDKKGGHCYIGVIGNSDYSKEENYRIAQIVCDAINSHAERIVAPELP